MAFSSFSACSQPFIPSTFHRRPYPCPMPVLNPLYRLSPTDGHILVLSLLLIFYTVYLPQTALPLSYACSQPFIPPISHRRPYPCPLPVLNLLYRLPPTDCSALVLSLFLTLYTVYLHRRFCPCPLPVLNPLYRLPPTDGSALVLCLFSTLYTVYLPQPTRPCPLPVLNLLYRLPPTDGSALVLCRVPWTQVSDSDMPSQAGRAMSQACPLGQSTQPNPQGFHSQTLWHPWLEHDVRTPR